MLKKYLNNTLLSEGITNVIIPSYNLGSNKAVFFKTKDAQQNDENNFYMSDIAYATSAAPTYFKPALISDLTNQDYVLIDGGMATNNPALDAYIYAKELFGDDCDYLIISIGTGTNYNLIDQDLYLKPQIIKGGKLHWAADIASLLMYSASDVVDYQLSNIFNESSNNHYYRLQVNLTSPHSAMDDISIENIQILEESAQRLIYENNHQLNHIASILENS